MSRKIVIIGTTYPFRGGGIATSNERLAREYLKNGDRVIIHTFSLQYPSFLFPGKSQYAEREKPTDLDISVTINSINPLNWFSAGLKIKNQRPDIVIIRYWLPFMAASLGTVARRIKKNKHSKIISIVDNIIPHEKRPGDKILSRYFVNSVDGFVAMSKSVLKDIDIFDKSKPKLYCPLPLYDNFGEPKSKQEALRALGLDSSFKHLLFFGLIRDYKGLGLLIEAMSKQKLKKYRLKLLVAGEFYTDPAYYYNLVKKYNLEDTIIFANRFIPDEEVVNYFCASDVIVQPYKNATQSGVTQIGYHFNKPMIVTNVGGLPEIITDGKAGYVVNTDADEIANAIDKFYTLHKEEEFSENAKKEKRRFSWENMLNCIDELCNKINVI